MQAFTIQADATTVNFSGNAAVADTDANSAVGALETDMTENILGGSDNQLSTTGVAQLRQVAIEAKVS